jgi:hypothetical protein
MMRVATRGTHERKENALTENQMEEDTLQDRGLEKRIKLK